MVYSVDVHFNVPDACKNNGIFNGFEIFNF